MNLRAIFAPVVTLAAITTSAQANFHVMQIEEIIGGVNGDPTAQAIQLRLRAGGQNVVSNGRIRAWDALGANPVVLLDIATNVSGFNGGDNVLLTTSKFNTYMSSVPGYTTDFTLANAIPASYLSGGKVTFEADSGSIYWAVAFGAYTGTNLAFDTTNDANADFGSPFASALPTSTRQGIRFTGAFSAPSTTNVADYALTANPATVRNNAGTSFTVVPEPASFSFIALGAAALGGVVFARRRR